MTFRRLSRLVIGIPLLLIMVSFALTNADPVRLGLFPLGHLPFEVPVSVAILAALGVGYFIGGLHLWFPALRHRRAARRAEEAMRLMEVRHQAAKSSDPSMTTTRG